METSAVVLGREARVPEVLCIGETMALVTPARALPLREADVFHIVPGGAESNVAMHLANAGHDVEWFSLLGADPLGDRVADAIAAHGVSIGRVRRLPDAQTGVYFKDPGHGERRVHYYRAGSAASRMRASDLDGLPLAATRVVHASGITPVLSESCRELVEALAARAGRAEIVLSFDINHRPALWPAAEAAPVLLALARRAQVVFVGLDEAAALWGAETPAAVRALLPDPVLVVKDGAIGATEFSATGVVHVPTPPVEVVEAIGAGDAFAAGYLSSRLRGAPGEAALLAGHRQAALALSTTADVLPVAHATSHPRPPDEAAPTEGALRA